jgi:hypothetical protein
MSCFSPPKNDRQLTSFTTHFTTTSPQKHHTKHALFAKIPSKKPHFTTPKKISSFNTKCAFSSCQKQRESASLCVSEVLPWHSTNSNQPSL